MELLSEALSSHGVEARCAATVAALGAVAGYSLVGTLASLRGPTVQVAGLTPFLAVGDRVALRAPDGQETVAEVAGFDGSLASALPLGPAGGLGARTRVVATPPLGPGALRVANGWLGRVVDPLGRPLDGGGPVPAGPPRPTRDGPPPALARAGLGPVFGFGVRALDAFTPARTGQRLGVFAGSGVGKSTLLGMLARNVACDVVVAALVGERGREVRGFVHETLGEAAMRRAVLVVATSDAPPMLRREAAYAATAIAEHFRDQGLSVLLVVDSLTRTCQALREVGLALGELPGTRGWPPSVFAELPRLLERAGPGRAGQGSITGLYTVLVEGDDPDEPVADAARGLLDGHIWLDRHIAERGRFPAVNVLRSLSRTAHDCLGPAERRTVAEARSLLSRAGEAAELQRLGVYARGSDAATDAALDTAARIEAWLAQDGAEASRREDAHPALAALLDAA